MEALQGIKVLDLTRLLPGSFASLMLADYVIEVVMIEDPAGEPGRHGSFYRRTGWSPPLLCRNKKSVTLNLRTAGGRTLLKHLSRVADVLLENFRPGYLDGLGLGFSIYAKSIRDWIYCLVWSMGQNGPCRNEPGHDINYIGRTGRPWTNCCAWHEHDASRCPDSRFYGV